VRTTASVTVAKARIELPTVTGARTAAAGPGAGVLPESRRCVSRRRFTIHLRPRAGRLRSAKVWVDGRRVKVHRRHGRLDAVVDLRGKPKQRVRVRVHARTTAGRVIRETRRYRTCAGAAR
jgi:ABC-2 type transport system ATP-binding protein